MPYSTVMTNEYKRMRGQLIMRTSIKPPEDPLGTGAISLTCSSPLKPAQKVPSYSQLPEPTPVPNPPSTVGAAESTEQLPESHAVNAAPVIHPTATHIVAEAAFLSSQPASAVPSISATTDTAGAAQSSTTAPIRNPTSGEPTKNLATQMKSGQRGCPLYPSEPADEKRGLESGGGWIH